jgi:hypothetical protein
MAVKTSCVAILIALALTGAAAAETPDDSSGRYTMSPVDGGFLRLDKQTGAIAMCARSEGDWACNPVRDRTAAAPSDELSKLEDENKALKDRIKALEESLESSKPAPPPSSGPPAEGSPGGKVQLPTEEEVDQALDYLEHVYKKFRDRIKDLDKPLPPPADGSAKPPPPDGSVKPDKGSL